VQRFGSALNAHAHPRCCVTDGVFSLAADSTLRFHGADALDAGSLAAVQRRIRSRVLRRAVRYGALTPDLAALIPPPRATAAGFPGRQYQ